MTPTLTPPFKTQLGHDELRLRTHGLGQRHRTILLLVDGRRPLSKVLSLSHQAGAETSHFEELVRLGLVEVPAEAMAPEPRETSPGGLDVLRVTSIELEVAEAPEVAAATPETAPPLPAAAPLPADVVEPHGAQADPPPAVPIAPQTVRTEIQLPTVAARFASKPPPRPNTPIPVRPLAPQVKTEAMEKGGEAWLQHVRELLIDTLRIDSPMFSARIFVQVRVAKSARELITVVWEIERHLSHTHLSRSELISLHRARELLGLGNTVVASDSQSQPEDS